MAKHFWVYQWLYFWPFKGFHVSNGIQDIQIYAESIFCVLQYSILDVLPSKTNYFLILVVVGVQRFKDEIQNSKVNVSKK